MNRRSFFGALAGFLVIPGAAIAAMKRKPCQHICINVLDECCASCGMPEREIYLEWLKKQKKIVFGTGVRRKEVVFVDGETYRDGQRLLNVKDGEPLCVDLRSTTQWSMANLRKK